MSCICQKCGRKYRVDFLVDNRLWDKIRDGKNTLCPVCVAEAIESIGEYASFSIIDIKRNSSYKRWDKKEDDFLISNFKNMTAVELASYLGRPDYAISARASKLGLRKNKKHLSIIRNISLSKRRHFWTNKEIEIIKENYNKKTYREIGEILNRKPIAVQQKARKLGLNKYSHTDES